MNQEAQSKPITIILFVIGLALVSSFMIMAGDTPVGIKESDPAAIDAVFKTLTTTDTQAKESVFEMANPEVKTLTADALSFQFTKVCGDVPSYKVYVLENITRDVADPVYSKEEECVDAPVMNNQTEPPKEELVRTCTIPEKILDYTHRNVTTQEWVEVKTIPLGSREYKIVPDLKIARCNSGWGYAIDWVPTLTIDTKEYTQAKWAWWNTTYGNRTFINCSSVTAGQPIVVNGSTGFLMPGDANTRQIVWTKCTAEPLYVYWNSVTDYAIGNESSLLDFEVEVGNVSSTANNKSIWSDYFNVLHGTFYNSTSLQDSATGLPIDKYAAYTAVQSTSYAFAGYSIDLTGATTSNIAYRGKPTTVAINSATKTFSVIYLIKHGGSLSNPTYHAQPCLTQGAAGATVYLREPAIAGDRTERIGYWNGVGFQTAIPETANVDIWVSVYDFGPDSGNGQYYIYMNNSASTMALVYNASATRPANPTTNLTLALFDVDGVPGSNWGFQGYTDEIRVYNGNFTPAFQDQMIKNKMSTAGYGVLGVTDEAPAGEAPSGPQGTVCEYNSTYYNSTGNWRLNLSWGCNITRNFVVNGAFETYGGPGSLSLSANISNATRYTLGSAGASPSCQATSSAYPCYQETATTATGCGGLATGVYGVAAASDYFVNYTKPGGSDTTSKWMAKYGYGPTEYNNNLTIPSSCWGASASIIQFRVTADVTNDGVDAYCKNTTGWQLLNSTRTTSGGGIACTTPSETRMYDGSWATGSTYAATCSGWTIESDIFDNSFSTLYEEAMWWNGTNTNGCIVTCANGGCFR